MQNDVTLRLLRYFTVLSQELNYRRAAEVLFISQPALSAAIRQLEAAVGGRLFDRDTRSVALTDLGQKWLPSVEKALREVDLTLATAADLVGRSHVRIGYLIGTGADLLFRLLDDLGGDLAGVTVETIEYDFSDPTAGLGSGASDIAIVRPPVLLPGLEMVVVARETWVACLPRAHALASRESLVIGELLDEPIVVAPASAGSWRDYWMAADVRGDRPAVIAAEAATYEAETTMVSRGVGISFTTSSTSRLYDRPGLAFVPILDRPVSYTTVAWRPDRLSTSAARLVQHMLERIPPEPGTNS
ncbi:LysR family transcriptional regulator [Frigoribacterium sp. CFBP 13729]|jgi:DNA-binding transcriptional LysR family regulator|uniref:LysR family transcriptional regulator n=1 Tax=unclassified Frigoribacterium TaxID=2627005 RepID=UPI00177C5E39|nr:MULTISPECIES: LysR family transcriptional regulator [unclassified Frigoribacterium]MBD8585663.1 LysR family transcriptional regulator [Frigoribacterium sp. CFBP 8766]MBD8611766.1 LysR family transcriptional regulator [Frigoribacterium sp. CFBP 13729]